MPKRCDKPLVQLAYADLPGERFSGEIMNLSGSTIRLAVSKNLLADAKILLEMSPRCIAEGVVLYCVPEDNRFVASVTFEAGKRVDQRREERTRFVRPATVTALGKDSGVTCAATTTDISPSGLGLQLKRSLTVGMLVRVELAEMALFGEVRHCRREGALYRAGISVEQRLDRNLSRGVWAKVRTFIVNWLAHW